MNRLHVGFVVAALIATLPAHAQEVPRASQLEMQVAADLYARGIKQHEEGNDEEARLSFLQAYAVQPYPNPLFALARTEQLTGRELEAMEHYLQCAKHPDLARKGSPKLPEMIRERIAELSKSLGRIRVDAPSGARVVIDGTRSVGDTPLADPIYVKPGRHMVAVALGERRVASDVTVAAGEEAYVSAAPSPVEVKPSPARDAPTPPLWTARRTVGVGVAGVGLIALGGALYFEIRRQDQADRAASLRASMGPSSCAAGADPRCAALEDAYDSADRHAVLGRVLLGAGAAAVAVGGALLLWPTSPEPTKRTLWVIPALSPSSGGLQIRGEL